MRYDHRYRHIELVANLDPQLPALIIVSDQFTQIFMNLLINAADAFGSHPKSASQVLITTRLLDASIMIKVEDNGSGMDEATVNQAFDPFFTTKTDKQGSGLGLAVCKSIIDAYGGTITLKSKPGIGTEVTIILPLDCCGTICGSRSLQGCNGSTEKTSLAVSGEQQ